jgi:asparagine synthase (glutamine-hydrolysing)
MVGAQESPTRHGACLCWVEGEFFEIAEGASGPETLDGQLGTILLDAWRTGRLTELLARIDGRFAAVLYDPARQQLLLITDRYGLKPLFLWSEAGRFGFASELKAFLCLPGFTPRIRADAVSCFVGHHMLGDLTWFEGVELIPPSTVLTLDLADRRCTRQRYWSWSRIRPSDLSFREASEALSDCIRESVRAQFAPGGASWVPLSGGLDSRAVFAAIDESPRQTPAVTFGQEGSPEISIAAQVAAATGAPHQILTLDPKTWFKGRTSAVWRSDGMLNLVHIHCPEMVAKTGLASPVSLNGYLADITIGGGALTDARMNQRASERLAGEAYGSLAAHSPWEDDFFDTSHFDPYLLTNRSRRFINQALVLDEADYVVRTPLFTNRILELVYSLPDEYRSWNKLYAHSLVSAYPDLFLSIPWATTGRPLLEHDPREPRLLEFALRKIRLRYRCTNSAIGYAGWFREPRFVGRLLRILDPRKALYPSVVDTNVIRRYLLPHLARVGDYSDQLGRFLTLELWLQQVFEGRYRDEDAF